MTFIDEKSKYTLITLLPSKDRMIDAFLNFQNYVTKKFHAKLKVLRTDNGGEYTIHRFKEHLAKHDIVPLTHQNKMEWRKERIDTSWRLQDR